ncbi:MAG TPA: KTSC domain-containing protein [Thermoanaerobaculia bacterium]
MPERITFDSSVIAALTYNADETLLDVELTSGRIYRYWMVSSAAYEAFAQAPSPGQHFNSEIRDRFPFRELESIPRAV